jgi:(R)-amidase
MTTHTLTLALAQMRCEKAGIEANLAATTAAIAQVTAAGADILCLPEGSLTGYIDPLHYPHDAVSLDGPEVARLLALTRGYSLTLIAGLVETNPVGPPFITQLVARNGRLLGIYRKRTIPADESHLFTPGPPSGPASTPIFTHAGVPFGLAVCADIDTPAVFADAARADARLVFECAAPGLYGAQETREWHVGHDWWRGECHTKLARYARDYGLVIAATTQAGRTRDEDFPGGGYVFDASGACLAESADWSEGLLVARVAIADDQTAR